MDRKQKPSSCVGSEGSVYAYNSTSGVECGNDQDSLPIHSAPPLPGPRTWDGGRSEYLQITRDRVLPKVMELAQRLVPAAAKEVERDGGDWRLLRGLSSGIGSNVSDEGQENANHESGSARNDNGAAGLKTTGLHDDDIDVESGLCLPKNVAMAASGLALPGGDGDNFVDIVPVVPVDIIAAELDSDVALMDIEADALIASMRSNSLLVDGGGADEDNRSVSSFDSADDDGMGGEIRRLGQVVASLRHDLAGANIHASPRDDDNGMAPRSPAYLAEQLQTWKYFSLRNVEATRTKTAALVWAIALLWALVILLSGHMKLGPGVDGGLEDNWADVLGWLFS